MITRLANNICVLANMEDPIGRLFKKHLEYPIWVFGMGGGRPSRANWRYKPY
ncbi:hypothetical protein ABKV19_016165 [Rosa sericea]